MLLHEHRQKNLPRNHTGTINGVPSEAGTARREKISLCTLSDLFQVLGDNADPATKQQKSKESISV